MRLFLYLEERNMTDKIYRKLLIILSILLILGLVVFSIVYCSRHKHNGVIEDGFPTTTPVQLASVYSTITN